MFDEVIVRTEKQVWAWINTGLDLLWLKTFLTIINCHYIYHEILETMEVVNATNLGQEGHALAIRLLVYHNLVLYFLVFFSLIIFYYVVAIQSTIGVAFMTGATFCEMLFPMMATIYKQPFLFCVLNVMLTCLIIDAFIMCKMNAKVASRNKCKNTLMV